ncbi:S-adenosyl-L-methionine-dependent methyltransferase [Dichotomocladium elegans]|nr:S-adenosyl-L-methionine-dependent methyltransferase [Dichotomocladium elegans]
MGNNHSTLPSSQKTRRLFVSSSRLFHKHTHHGSSKKAKSLHSPTTSTWDSHIVPDEPPTPAPSNSHTVSSASSCGSAPEAVLRNGRKFHNVMDSIYWLPSDDEEMDRLTGQHFALKALFEGNIVKQIFSYIDLEKGAKILDIGCGPGTWLMDVATEYPDCELVGVDMCHVFPSDIRPANVQFIVGNVLERLPFDDNTFDFVNLRFLMLAFRKEDWLVAFREVFRVLKPGGCVQELESSMLDRGSPFTKWVGEVFTNVMRERGQEPYMCYKMGPLFEQAGLKPLELIERVAYLHRPDPLNKEFLWDICNIVKGAQPFLTEALGVPPEKFPQFLKEFHTECQKPPGGEWDIVINIAQKPVLTDPAVLVG